MLILNLICSFDILVLRSIIVDVRNSGLRATGIQRICGHWLIVIIVAVFLEVLLLSLNFVDLFFDLLNLSTDLAITSTVRTSIATLVACNDVGLKAKKLMEGDAVCFHRARTCLHHSYLLRVFLPLHLFLLLVTCSYSKLLHGLHLSLMTWLNEYETIECLPRCF